MEPIKILHLVSLDYECKNQDILFTLSRDDTKEIQKSIFFINASNKNDLKQENITVLENDGFYSLLVHIKEQNPDILHAWGIKAHLWGALAKLLLFSPFALCWQACTKKLNGLQKIGYRLFSFLVKRMIITSDQTIHYIPTSFPFKKRSLIPNGLDLSLFTINTAFKQSWRETWCIDDDVPILGSIANDLPEKGHDVLLDACVLLLQKNISFKLIMIGKDIDNENLTLIGKIHDRGLQNHVLCLGSRDDVHLILPVMDFIVSASTEGEIFPESLCQAMACGVPCIATNVGHCKKIIGDYGIVIPPKDPVFLMRAIEKMFSLDSKLYEELSLGCRQYMLDTFSIRSLPHRYSQFYQSIRTQE